MSRVVLLALFLMVGSVGGMAAAGEPVDEHGYGTMVVPEEAEGLPDQAGEAVESAQSIPVDTAAAGLAGDDGLAANDGLGTDDATWVDPVIGPVIDPAGETVEENTDPARQEIERVTGLGPSLPASAPLSPLGDDAEEDDDDDGASARQEVDDRDDGPDEDRSAAPDEQNERGGVLGTIPFATDTARSVLDPVVREWVIPLPRVNDLGGLQTSFEDETVTGPAAAPRPEVHPQGVAIPMEAKRPLVAEVAVLAVATVAMVGAVAATSGSKFTFLLRPWRIWAPLFWAGFYARVSKDRVLDHETRQTILDCLRGRPGACVSEIQDVVGVSGSTVTHHLRTLESNGLVISVKNGRRRCFFAAEDRLSPQARTAKATLASRAARRVFAVIERCPGIRQQELASVLGISPTSVVFHARRLEDAGVVRRERAGREMAYFPAVAV